jgi:transcription elongation GreA/GreB family factor
MTFKQQIYARCRELVAGKLRLLQEELKALSDSAANETKSTAGDKHETALAMLQLEQEKARQQLAEAREQLSVIDRLDISMSTGKAVMGSLVKTNRGYLFISLGLGKIIVEENIVIALSPRSPLGMKLIGTVVNDQVEVNGIWYTIEQIF